LHKYYILFVGDGKQPSAAAKSFFFNGVREMLDHIPTIFMR